MELLKKYELNIGLEIHVELSTKSKAFCSCPNKFGDEPNTNICPICIAIAGALPSLNKKVVEYAIKTGLALNCTINEISSFDRKHYFYPDLPKSYQITQMKFPICTEGFLYITGKDSSKNIRIKQIHIEEDAGKLIHLEKENKTFVDFNRSGVPLLEIVTYPDFSSEEEVISFLESLQQILIYLQVSDCKMQEGSMRVDINLSVKKINQNSLGTRTEMKNINSFKAIRNCIKNEAKRQITLLENGEKVIQQTRRWDEKKNCSFFMRFKENSSNYKYFNEPDLPIIRLSEELVAEIKNSLPELPSEKIERFVKEYKISEYEAKIIASSKNISQIFEEINNIYFCPKEICNLITGELFRLLSQNSISLEEVNLCHKKVASLVKLMCENKINRTVYKQVFEEIFENNVDPIEYVKEKNLLLVEDEDIILETIKLVFSKNEKAVNDYKAGKDKALGFLVGQAMKELKGKASPEVVHKTLVESLNKI